MIFPAILALMTVPALPPSGPVKGHFRCLFEYDSGLPTGAITFDEDATEGPDWAGGNWGYQVSMRQIPVKGDKISRIEFGKDKATTIFNTENKILGRLSYITYSDAKGGIDWFKFSVPLASGEMMPIGTCFGSINGRDERPVNMTKISRIRIDEIK